MEKLFDGLSRPRCRFPRMVDSGSAWLDRLKRLNMTDLAGSATYVIIPRIVSAGLEQYDQEVSRHALVLHYLCKTPDAALP